MKENSGVGLFLCACFGCILIIICISLFLFFPNTIPINEVVSHSASPPKEESTAESFLAEEKPESPVTSSAIETKTDGTAVGKITAKCFSPYNSSLKYNNVYINNKSQKALNIRSLLSKKISFKIKKNDKPQVLIIHTHTTEGYMLKDKDYYTTSDATHFKDEGKNMVAVGKIFADKLNEAGIGVIHCKTIHDYPSYSGSYDASAASIKAILKENPQIKIILDIHRDSISAGGTDKIKPTVKIGDKNAAQVMLVMGTNHKNYESNLALAVKYHQTMEVLYPSLARSITVYNKKYNQELSVGSMLIEVGTDSNTLNEALYGASLAANALVNLLNTIV